MKTNLLISLFVILSLVFIINITAYAGYHRDSRPGPRKNMVREPEIIINDNVTIPGFWRPKTRHGYRWITAARDDVGRWHSGYWLPINADLMIEKINYPGYWGPAGRDEFIWINRIDRVGEYPEGSWKKMNSYRINRAPLKWVPGHWDGRKWVEGYWRISEKEGYIWNEGYYNTDGRWQEALWIPAPAGN